MSSITPILMKRADKGSSEKTYRVRSCEGSDYHGMPLDDLTITAYNRADALQKLRNHVLVHCPDREMGYNFYRACEVDFDILLSSADESTAIGALVDKTLDLFFTPGLLWLEKIEQE